MPRKFLLVVILLSLFLPSSSFCAPEQNAFITMGRTTTTTPTCRVATTDSSQLLTSAIATALGATPRWGDVRSIWITCETNDFRLSYGTAAVQTGGSEVGHVIAAGTAWRIPSNDMIQDANIISKTNGSAAVLQITIEY